QIGSGKAFPDGYQGPDTMLYMYVGVNEVNNQTVPQPPVAFFDTLQQISTSDGSSAYYLKGQGLLLGVNTFLSLFNANLSDFTYTSSDGQHTSVNYTDLTHTNDLNQTLVNLNLPIQASGYTFVAPSDWGQRSTTGDLQNLVSQMVQNEADLDVAIATW